MQHRSIEKSIALSSTKVVLGREPVAEVSPEDASADTAPVDAATILPKLAPAEQIAELEQRLAAADARIGALESELAQARTSASASADELAALHDDLETARRTAEQRGYEDGSEAARLAAQESLDRALDKWRDGIDKLAAQHREYGLALRDTAGDIALAAATRVIGERLVDSAHIKAAIEHVIRESGLAGALKISVAPRHYEELTRADGLVQRLAGHPVELQPDESVAYGGCLLEAADASVDGRFEIQLQKLQRIVADFRAAEDVASPSGARDDAS